MSSLFKTALRVVSRERVRDARDVRALSEMRVRLERLRGLSASFEDVELSPYVASLLGKTVRRTVEPARRAAGI